MTSSRASRSTTVPLRLGSFPVARDVLAAIQAVGDTTSLYRYQHMAMARVAHDALLREAELVMISCFD